MSAVKADVAVIRSNYVTKADLAVVQKDVAVILSNYVTKTELAVMEATLLKWFIGTAITVCGVASSIAFAIAKLVH